MISRLILAAALAMAATPALPHDIYTGVHGKDGQLCCGADDCFRTTWREHGDQFDFLLPPDKRWVTLPADRITFLPIAGDDFAAIDGDQIHYGHICYRHKTEADDNPAAYSHVHGQIFGDFVIWCAFIPPGST